MPGPFTCRVASEPWEFEQIHRLNYRTFAEEIPQHAPNPEFRLIDRFHAENTYLIAVRDGRVCGMVALRGNRPFSLDAKVQDLDRFLPPHRRLCEVRLLAVEPACRGRRVLASLLRTLLDRCDEEGYDLCVISGTVLQRRLYEHLGFVHFGPLVGTPGALYQPMYLTRAALRGRVRALEDGAGREGPNRPVVNLLPGPVGMRSEVRQAMAEPPVSHRAKSFRAGFERLRAALCRLVNAQDVQVMLGTGSLANDAVAGQLSQMGAPGLVLTNGEFGDRLVDHARRFGLAFEVCAADWGCPFERAGLEAALHHCPEARWLWAVHGETSTGVLNDLDLLKGFSAAHDLRLCLDAVSSIGAVPVDLSGVAFASAVSGKGLGSYAGLCMVFHDSPVIPSARLPRYLDLGLYAAEDGVPFTQSSVLAGALSAALRGYPDEARFARRRALHIRVRRRLEARGFSLVAPASCAMPGVLTINLSPEVDSAVVGRRLQDAGYWLSFESGYLLRRNWIQVCLMGEVPEAALDPLPDLLVEACRPA